MSACKFSAAIVGACRFNACRFSAPSAGACRFNACRFSDTDALMTGACRFRLASEILCVSSIAVGRHASGVGVVAQ
ncbi:MAG: hypothetical protein GWP67_01915 [Gammaproteobacteria bacterium]|nr:hypothetical protein [Gammaproteobacteria bacterium]